ncbi:type I-E CRISPR-associated protein Cse2/CasB [Thermus brockianus]|uniref:CRISPR-associated Cse2 family protein n=1 Tax=Thermus brockianus TaxID=56956 RepID=A0A1J0LWJ6_THEBO|nr:CRISPR-associated Cse2 family protein [Thermus brockianus]BDG17473.1 CRISPR-associated protein Cse2 [Thermus brockianus]
MTGTAFVEWLTALQKGSGWTPARAALRRSLAFPLGTYPPAMPYVEPFVKAEGWAREAHYLVAGLFALKDGAHQGGRSLALALWEAARERDSKSVEKRFLALLDADRDQIAFRLRQAVGLVEGGLDFARLLDDLLDWFHQNRRVQARWAKEYYGAKEQDLEEEEVEG